MCICLSVSVARLWVSCGNFILFHYAVLSVLGCLSFVTWDIDLHLLELIKVCRYIVSVSLRVDLGICMYMCISACIMYIYA